MARLSTENPAARLLQLASGFRNTQALYVAAKLGVADHLVEGPKTCAELAPLTGAHEKSLFRVMRALASLGVFDQDSEDRFSLNPMGSLLVADAPGSVRAVVLVWGSEMYRATGELLMSVKTGKTAFDSVFGEGHFEYLGKHPDESETFNAMMAQMIRANPMRRSIERYDFSGRKTVVDVGGGVANYSLSILLRNPHLTGILYDLPAAVKEAPGHLMSRGVEGRVKIVIGSAFDSIPDGGDVYTMSRVLHDHPDDMALKILRNCRKAIFL